MKQFYLLLSLLFLSAGLSAQVFVDADASGAGDGTSWADAYTSLDAALGSATAGDEIWVAAGTYTPSGTRFEVTSEVSIYGGFAGNETSNDQADPDANPTILNGDVNGDDDAGDIQVNRTDNLQIMFVDSLMAGTTVIDGFTFVGGNLGATPDGGNAEDYAGGAILAYSTIEVSDCDFLLNAADFGGAIAIFGLNASESSFDGCDFVGGFGNSRGGGAYVEFTDDFTVTDCSFEGNLGLRSALYLVDIADLLVEDCTFDGNEAIDRGSGLGVVFCSPALVSECDFTNNIINDAGGRGAAVYVNDDFELDIDPERLVFEDCTFDNNATAGLLAGAFYALDSDHTIRRSDFNNNAAGTHGGAYFSLTNLQRQVVFDSCSFDMNAAGAGVASALGVAFPHNVDVMNTSFTANGNETVGSRGAFGTFGDFDSLDIVQTYNFDNVNFEGNFGTVIGAGLYMQSPTGTITTNINNSTFFNNNCINCAGGGLMSFESVTINMDNSEAAFNQSNDGGFAYVQGGAPDALALTIDAPLNITNSIIHENFAAGQGGAIDAQAGTDVNITNSLFYGNGIITGDPLSGGALIVNGDTVGQEVLLVNNTWGGNFATLAGDDVAAFASGALPASSNTMVTIINNAFVSDNGTGNISIEPDADGGMPVINSGGGNFFLQEPVDVNTVASDIFDDSIDPATLFTNVDFGDLSVSNDFTLNEALVGNPLIDAGVTGPEVPDTDIRGVMRDANPDIGAYEAAGEILPTVAEIIADSPDHTVLEGALDMAGLTATLNGDGPFTVFAPTDDAFANLALNFPDLSAAILGDAGLLEVALLTHVVGDELRSEDLTDGLTVASLAPATSLNFTNDGSGTITVTTTGSPTVGVVTVADLLASNGVVHVIDMVLVPLAVNVRDIEGSGIQVEFFPNPVQNLMNVRVDELGVDNMNISVINLNGQRINNWTLGNGNNTIDFSRVPAGTYTLEINIDGEIYSKQVVKQ